MALFIFVYDRKLGLPSKPETDTCLDRSVWESDDKGFPIHTLLPKRVAKQSQLLYSFMTSLSHLEILARSSNSWIFFVCFFFSLFLGSPIVQL